MRLELIGPFRLVIPDAVVALPKKVQGVLAYLAMHAGRVVAREHLAHLLWCDSGATQARHSLRQSLASLRAAICSPALEIIVADSAGLKFVNSEAIDIDISRFELLARSTELEGLSAAIALYRGEFLAGLHVSSEPFSEWVAGERRRLAAVMSDVLYRLAGGLGHDVEAAIAAAQQLAAFDPLREDAHRLLMRLLATVGRRDAALRQYLSCAAILKRELGVAPEPETAALAETIRRGALREPEPPRASSENARPRRRTGARGARHEGANPGRAPPDKPSIVVLPFANLCDDPDQYNLVTGIVEDVTNALGREPWLRVISSKSALHGAGAALSVAEVNADLGVRYVLDGSVRKQRDRLRITVGMTDATTHAHIWASRFDAEHDDVFDLQDRITRQIAGTLLPRLRLAEIERVKGTPPASDCAYDLFLRALRIHRTSPESNREALRLLDKAIAIDPLYAAACGLAARCWQLQKTFGWVPPGDGVATSEGLRLAHRAAEIGGDDPEALWMAGRVIAFLAGEIEHGLALIEKSISLNPNSSSAWMAAGGVSVFHGDAARALACLDEARRLNPLDPLAQYGWLGEARAHFLSGRYEQAANAADKALHIQPGYAPALRVRAGTCGILGRGGEGAAFVKRLLAVNPDATVAQIRDHYQVPMGRNPAVLEALLDGLQRSGLPLA